MKLIDDPRWSRAAALAKLSLVRETKREFADAVIAANSLDDLSDEHRAIIERADRELTS